jgi:hypothetical protein
MFLLKSGNGTQPKTTSFAPKPQSKPIKSFMKKLKPTFEFKWFYEFFGY